MIAGLRKRKNARLLANWPASKLASKPAGQPKAESRKPNCHTSSADLWLSFGKFARAAAGRRLRGAGRSAHAC